MNNKIPWVEKYRPKTFENIVLSDTNKIILKNIIENNYFPNLLLYGLPGTGKTTTIINLIELYQATNEVVMNANMIHLNASDERGIDIVRNQINMFVSSNTIFNQGVKFVILDEVDYMTKNAQQALSYLIEQNYANVRFCLICNYISRIETSLQEKFIFLRFNSLPKQDIKVFLEDICFKEGIQIKPDQIDNIITTYKSDMRSMINFIQANHNNIENICMTSFDELDKFLILCKIPNNIKNIETHFNNIYINNNVSKFTLLKNIFSYIIYHKAELLSKKLVLLIKIALHSDNTNNIISYSLLDLNELLS
jgi:DNA polymerase III delta prime subunit